MVNNPKKVTIVKKVEKNANEVFPNQTHSLEVELGKGAGLGEISCCVIGPEGEIPFSIKQLSGNKREVLFVPEIPGSYEVQVFYGKCLIPGTPYFVKVSPFPPEPVKSAVEGEKHHSSLPFKVDPNKVTITGFLEGNFLFFFSK